MVDKSVEFAEALEDAAAIIQAVANSVQFQSIADTLENYVRELQAFAKQRRIRG